MAEAKFKKGDKLRCKPGFDSKKDDHHPQGGGSGYLEALEIEVGRITSNDEGKYAYKGHIYWPIGGRGGIYEIALEKVSEVVNAYPIF